MPKRRANGEGSITQRKDGLWMAQYTDNAGKRRALYGKTQQEVRLKMKEAIKESDKGLILDKGKITLAQWMYEWLEVYVKPTVRQRTYSLYYYSVKNHIEPALGSIPLKDLRPDMIQRFINDKAISGRLDGVDGGLGVSMLRDFKKVIYSALKRAVENNIVAYNVCTSVKIPTRQKKEKVILSLEEQKKLEDFISTEKNPRTFAIILSLYTGLRMGEIIALKVDDIDLENKLLHVRHTLSYARNPETGREESYVNEPKTKSGKRSIPLPDFLVKQIKDYGNVFLSV